VFVDTKVPIRVIAISGSLRRASSNSAVVEAAVRLAPDFVEVSIYRELAALPPFNPDLDNEDPTGVRRQISSQIGDVRRGPDFMSGNPHGVPGVLKNALDWVVAPAKAQRAVKTYDESLCIMSCCSTFSMAMQRQFSPRVAARDLARYRRKGPNATTRMLCQLITTSSLTNSTMLDIGAGIGALPFELLSTGFRHATAVDASPAYVAAGQQEAERRGLGNIEWLEGDFVDWAPRLTPADVVTLVRVVCCSRQGPRRDAPIVPRGKRHSPTAEAHW